MTIRTLLATKDTSTISRVKSAFFDVDIEVIPASTLALAVFLARKNFPDVILADFELSDGDGVQLLHEIKSETELQAIPFALLNSLEECGLNESQARELGISALISKDTPDRDLYEKIMKLVRGYLAIKESRAEETPE